MDHLIQHLVASAGPGEQVCNDLADARSKLMGLYDAAELLGRLAAIERR